MQEPTRNQGAPEAPEFDYKAYADGICGPVLGLKANQTATLPHPADKVLKVLRRHLPHQLAQRVTATDTPGGCLVTVGEAPRGRGRPPKSDAIHARLLAMEVGAVEIWGDVNPSTLTATASRMRARGVGSYRIIYSDETPPRARVERIDGLTVTDGYGREVRLDQLAERTIYPFRTMKPGDRFTVLMGLHTGLHNMRATCSKFGRICGYTFTATEHRDGSITVECAYRQGVEVTPKGQAEVERRKSQAPQRITLIWD